MNDAGASRGVGRRDPSFIAFPPTLVSKVIKFIYWARTGNLSLGKLFSDKEFPPVGIVVW